MSRKFEPAELQGISESNGEETFSESDYSNSESKESLSSNEESKRPPMLHFEQADSFIDDDESVIQGVAPDIEVGSLSVSVKKNSGDVSTRTDFKAGEEIQTHS